jgi:hypothetical protein
VNSIITARVFASKHRTAPPHRDRGRGNTGALRRVFSASQPEGDDHVSNSAKALVAAFCRLPPSEAIPRAAAEPAAMINEEDCLNEHQTHVGSAAGAASNGDGERRAGRPAPVAPRRASTSAWYGVVGATQISER